MHTFRKRAVALLLLVMMLSMTHVLLSRTIVQPAEAELATALTDSASTNFTQVDLSYLTSHPAEFHGSAIAATGVVRFYASIYMYEDFWLQSQANSSARIPAVVRFVGVPVPREGTHIKVFAKLEYSNLEGGFFFLNVSSFEESKNVILIGWDGVQRNHLLDLLQNGSLPSLKSFIANGLIVNVTVTDHRTDTKSGWTQIMTGYRWWKTGVYNNAYWFHSIPAGYTIPERVEHFFGKQNIATAHITGKMGNMEAQNETSTAKTGLYTHEAIFANVPSAVDVCSVGDRNASVVGPLALQFIENYSKNHFFAFFHFSDPDSAGHNQNSGGENSALYEQAIVRCDYWLGQILNKLTALNITQNTLLYVTADHGFDEGKYSHSNAPFVSLATNDKRVMRNGDQVDVAPTVYYGLGAWSDSFTPELDGYPLQSNLPEGVEQKRQSVLADSIQPQKPSITSPANGLHFAGTMSIEFRASDKNLCTVLLLVNNTLKADGPWTWRRNETVEANGSFDWDTTNIEEGSYTITVLAFDEHGAANSPSTRTVTVNVVPELPFTPNFNVGTLPQQYSAPQASPTQQQNNQSATPPIVQPPNNPPEKAEDAIGTGFPMEYVYETATAAAAITAIATVYHWARRKK